MTSRAGDPAALLGPQPTSAASSQGLGFQLNVLVPGLYVWASTLALPALGQRAPGPARAAALVALSFLLAGPMIAKGYPRFGRVLGIEGFVLASTLGWVWLERAGFSFFGRPLEATFGAVGWMLFAFGWGDLRARRGVPEQDPHVLAGPALSPRSVLPRSVGATLAIGVAGALLLVVLAWQVSRPAHAMMAHAAAVFLGLLLVGSGARIALERGPRRALGPTDRLSSASTGLAVLLIALGLGALYWMLER